MNYYSRWLKDPWILFALISAVIAIGLIVVPQLWILRVSMQEEGGKFHLKAESAEGRIHVIPETVERYDLQEQENRRKYRQEQKEPDDIVVEHQRYPRLTCGRKMSPGNSIPRSAAAVRNFGRIPVASW